MIFKLVAGLIIPLGGCVNPSASTVFDQFGRQVTIVDTGTDPAGGVRMTAIGQFNNNGEYRVLSSAFGPPMLQTVLPSVLSGAAFVGGMSVLRPAQFDNTTSVNATNAGISATANPATKVTAAGGDGGAITGGTAQGGAATGGTATGGSTSGGITAIGLSATGGSGGTATGGQGGQGGAGGSSTANPIVRNTSTSNPTITNRAQANPALTNTSNPTATATSASPTNNNPVVNSQSTSSPMFAPQFAPVNIANPTNNPTNNNINNNGGMDCQGNCP